MRNINQSFSNQFHLKMYKAPPNRVVNSRIRMIIINTILATPTPSIESSAAYDFDDIHGFTVPSKHLEQNGNPRQVISFVQRSKMSNDTSTYRHSLIELPWMQFPHDPWHNGGVSHLLPLHSPLHMHIGYCCESI